MMTEPINITEQQADFIRQRVESGDFEDASEVVRAGIRLLQDSQAERLEREAALRTILIKAKESGVSDCTPQEVWAAVEARYDNNDA